MKRKKAKKTSRIAERPILTNQETWMLLQDVFVLLEEAQRVFKRAIECDERLQRSRKYRALLKKLRLEGS